MKWKDLKRDGNTSKSVGKWKMVSGEKCLVKWSEVKIFGEMCVHIFEKRVRKVIISDVKWIEVKWRDLKRNDNTSKSVGKWKMVSGEKWWVKWSEDLW